LEAGEPGGWNYRGGELQKELRALEGMRPAESVGYIQALSRVNVSTRTNVAGGSAF
jgi:hypothetical protein